MKKRYNLFLNDRLAEAIEAKAAEEMMEANEWIKETLRAHALGKCGAAAPTQALAATDAAPSRGPGRPPNPKSKKTEAQVRAMGTEELQDFLEETGFISVGGVEPCFQDGKKIDGTYEKKFVRMDPKTLTNEYVIGYYYNNDFSVPLENLSIPRSINELIGLLKKEDII